MTDELGGAQAPSLRIGLNQHLSDVVAHSTTPIRPANIGAASNVFVTTPVQVHYADALNPGLDFVLPPAAFVAIEQAAGWVYGLTINPQLTAAPLSLTLPVARQVERVLDATRWTRAADDPRVTDEAARAWVAGADEELAIGQYRAGGATLRVTMERTDAPSPSERLLGKREETYFVNVRITDFSRHDAYEARVLTRARAQGVPVNTLRLDAFMRDTAGR